MPSPTLTAEILAAALQGLELQRDRIDGQIAEVKRWQRGTHEPAAAAPAEFAGGTEGPRPRRKMSASARKRIAEAQRKRWAVFHEQSPTAGKKPVAKATAAKAAKPAAAPKRKLSAAGKRAIAEAARKRWAEFRKANKPAVKKAAKKSAKKTAAAAPAASA